MIYNGSCMNFSNDEIKSYLVNRLVNNDKLECRFYIDYEIVPFNCKDNFEIIKIGQGEQEPEIHFYNDSASIFIYNEEFMFIDDDARQYYTISDVYDCIVYEGKLREYSHKQILDLFYKLIRILHGATDITILKNPRLNQYHYPSYDYNVKITNNLQLKGTYQFYNIFIEIKN